MTKAPFTLDGKTVLVTGGTGSFGRAFAETILRQHRIAKLIVLSRDELKQSEMAKEFKDPRIRFFLGDVRDRDRLSRAFGGVDLVVHAAALKQVPACEYNPFEAVKTNIIGATNVIEAAIDRGVTRVVGLSTDKAVSPVNLYGATKLCAEKLFVQANAYVAGVSTRFSCVRYGNVVGSRGSVVPLFLEQRRTGRLTITDERMTRFFLTLPQGVERVLRAATEMRGGEVYVPRIPSMRVVDLAAALAPECKQEVVGIRPGEKLHEVLISEDESRQTIDAGDHFVLEPNYDWASAFVDRKDQRRLPTGFRYGSDTNDRWLSVEELRAMVAGA